MEICVLKYFVYFFLFFLSLIYLIMYLDTSLLLSNMVEYGYHP
jgi:hypothetical protein